LTLLLFRGFSQLSFHDLFYTFKEEDLENHVQ